MPDDRASSRIAAAPDSLATATVPPAEAPTLAMTLARSFELVAGIALFVLVATALVVVLVPSSAQSRTGFAIELVVLGIALVLLGLILSRRSAAAVTQPLQLLEGALGAITAGDLTVRVRLAAAALEIQTVGASVNTMVQELARLKIIEAERTKDERVRRELAEVVHESLAVDHVVLRAVEVVGAALEVDRVHIRLLDRDEARLVAEWRASDAVTPLPVSARADELEHVAHLIGVTDGEHARAIDDATDPERYSIEARAAFEELAVVSALACPIAVGTGIEGVLVASRQLRPRAWTESDVTLMESFAREIGRALDHALAFQLQDRMVERLGVLDRAKNEFLCEVSRELRGPLASVLGYIELLTDDPADAVTSEQQHMLAVVRRNSEELLVIIDDLLTVSRIEAGTFTPTFAAVDVGEIVRNVCAEITPAVAAAGLRLEEHVARDVDLVGDGRQIERALLNLATNAVKFTPVGGHVDVSVRRDGDEVVFDVRDTGIGVTAGSEDELFTRFFTARAEPRRETLGAGLGLYIVKQIVDGHRGSVGVSSIAGHGSTFTLRFPARPRPAGAQGGEREGGARNLRVVVS